MVGLQDNTNSVGQTEKTTAGEAGACSGGGEDQKGTVCVWDTDTGTNMFPNVFICITYVYSLSL